MWAGKGVLLWGGEQVDISSMFAGKGVLLWRGGQVDISAMFAGKVSFSGEVGIRQVDISAHLGLEGCPFLERWAGRYICPCWLGRVSFSGEVSR